MIPFLLNKQYNTVYIVLNKNKEIFASFLKLPKIREYFLENAIIFENTKIMQLFFEEYSEFYIPRSIIAKDSQEYVTFFKDLHKRRLLKKREKNNVFLTIGIPSYNRGKILLENVKQLLNLEYDAEIEIVVSNNGSKIEADYYDLISKINDSRLVYTSFEANQGYASNVLNVMTHASGHFLVMCSDEDFLVLDKLSGFIQFLFENLQMAMSYTGGYGSNFENGTIQMYPAGIQAIECAVNSNYLTGLVFNNSIISKYKQREFICRILCSFGDSHDNSTIWRCMEKSYLFMGK